MAIVDLFTYNGEMQIARLHMAIMAPTVDRFIIVEANKTFSGKDKPLYFFRDQRYFKEWWNKIDYYVMNDWDDPLVWQQAVESPNTKGASHWKREFYIKECIHKAMEEFKVQDTDLVFIGDVDEVVDIASIKELPTPTKAKLRVYTYWLNNRSTEVFHGTLIALYKDIKDKCLNHLRSDKTLYSDRYLGWHFTSQGGQNEVRRKLEDSYTNETLHTTVLQYLDENMKISRDFLGRDFTFIVDESEWPQYLKDNKAKYKALCR